MKSKKAKIFLDAQKSDPYFVHAADRARVAVELAEEDARERAVKAVCGSCMETKRPKKCLAINPENCLRLSGFKKHYDNEQ